MQLSQTRTISQHLIAPRSNVFPSGRLNKLGKSVPEILNIKDPNKTVKIEKKIGWTDASLDSASLSGTDFRSPGYLGFSLITVT